MPGQPEHVVPLSPLRLLFLFDDDNFQELSSAHRCYRDLGEGEPVTRLQGADPVSPEAARVPSAVRGLATYGR